MSEDAGADTRDGEATLRRCATALRCGEAEAQTLLVLCLTRFPQASQGWVEIGEVLAAKGKGEAALLCLARGLPTAALAIRRGLLARDLGRRDEARAAFAQATTLDPTSARAWFLFGTAAEDARDPAAAADCYARVLALEPMRAEAAVNLGMVLQAKGDLDGAKAAYARAVRTRPDTFGRIAQALPGAPKGELWLDLAALRRSLSG